MRPPISLTLQPGLERGVPWGRDLYTFVTSAAGHMMRTLQKPRKNRPSKRQVNHRRFLHNMIQRKFADIEAANHQLASALFSTKDKFTSLPSQKPVTPDQSGSPSQDVSLKDPDKGSAQTGMDGISNSGTDLSLNSHETEVGEKKQPDSGHLWKLQPKSQPKTCTTRKNNQGKGTCRQTHEKGSENHKLVEFISLSSPSHTDYYHRAELFHPYGDENPLWETNNLSEDSLCSWSEKEKNDAQFKHDSNSNIIQLCQNPDTSVSPSFSPELSPLSLDSCDFSFQMVTDVTTCTQAKVNIADIVEDQWTDMMDLLNVDDKDLGDCMDMEAYFESICACQGDVGGMGGEVCADDIMFVDQSESLVEKMIIRSNDNFTSEVEDVHCERGEYGYEHGYSYHGDQGPTVNHFISDHRGLQCALARESEEATEIQFTNFESPQGPGIIPNHLSTSTSSFHYDIQDLNSYQRPQQECVPSMLSTCERNQTCTPFAGVAQSFCVPPQSPQHLPIPTPPGEDEWLFTDILEDRKSPKC